MDWVERPIDQDQKQEMFISRKRLDVATTTRHDIFHPRPPTQDYQESGRIKYGRVRITGLGVEYVMNIIDHQMGISGKE